MNFNTRKGVTERMVLGSMLDRVSGSRLAALIAAHPRAVLTAGMVTLLLLSADTAAAETIDFGVGTTSVGDASEGP